MLYHLLVPYISEIHFLRLFKYITFRSAIALMLCLILSLIIGPYLINYLKKLKVKQYIRDVGMEHHIGKEGTPTMGGILIIAVVAVITLLCARLDNPFIWILQFALVSFAIIGGIDDYLKIVKKKNEGFKASHKFLLQVLAATIISGWLVYYMEKGLFTANLNIPFFKNIHPDLGIFYIPFAVLVIVGSSNAVNLTDGLDGLAIGSVLISVATYAILSYACGNYVVASYLGIPNVKETGELTILMTGVMGASLGFLWFNATPAEIFMGDVGSLSLGATIGTLALIIKEELLLVIIGGLFVVEALSVLIQVSSYKLRGGKRVFLCAPLHHHFEKKGWKESKVVVRFWILAIIFSLMGLATLKVR